MKKILFINFLVCVMGLVSCKKKLLDSVPKSQYTDAAVFKDSTLVNLYVNKIYSGLPNEYGSDIRGNYTDESTCIANFVESYGFNQHQVTADTFSPSTTLYTSFFVNIRLCNVFLDNIGQLNASTVLKSRLTGEVRFLRAVYSHYLYSYFGRFPILRTTLQLGDNLFVTRGSDADCINFITSELNAAASLLPVKYAGLDLGRATKGAAYALLSRVYLYDGQWKNSADAAKEVMGLGIYKLFPDYQALFFPQNENNSEVIFDRQYLAAASSNQSNSVDALNAPSIYTGRNSGYTNPSETMVSMYQMTDGSAFDWNNPLQAANPYANRDPRLDASIMHDKTVWQGRTLDMTDGSIFNPLVRPCVTGYYLKKFLNPNFVYGDASTSSGQNFILLRYAEVLLNYAEAEFRLGNTEEARTYVNAVRARPSVNMPEISSAKFTWDSYTNERMVELAFEGLRLWDINRWKIGPQTRGSDLYGVKVTSGVGGVHIYKKVVSLRGGIEKIFTDRDYLFPIPSTEVQKYPGNSLDQNPGW